MQADAAITLARGRALPALREDLKLEAAPRSQDGSPCWHLVDPVRNRFFRLGWLEFELLARWHGCSGAEQLCQRVGRETALAPEPDDVDGLLQFLQANELLRADAAPLRAALQRMAGQRRLSHWQWLLHHYLFFRIPLVRPEAFLVRTAGWVAPLFHRALPAWLALLSVVALWRILDQWPAFSQTFLYFFSWEGALWYGLALALAKVVHELAHAYTCRHYGVRVPAMGVAVMLLWPLLYTDTSEAWKLPARRARLAIGAAGVVAELMLAAAAALAWSVLPDGVFKSAAYVLAAVTWISTLAINLNPFMRFDGYYLLMDALDIPNLAERSFAIGRWRLRSTLLGVAAPMPEPQLAARQGWLCLYAYLTWIYRLVLFVGIAAMVYYLFFKLAGVILFVVEIGWFVLRPIAAELRVWRSLRPRWSRRARASAALLGAALLALALPWRADVHADGYWQAREDSRVFAPAAARVSAILVREGEAVVAGQPLFALADPLVESQSLQLQSRIAGLEAQLAGAIGQASLRDAAPVFERQLAAARAEQLLQSQERERLTVRAPHAGVVRDLDRGLFGGAWVGPRHALARVVGGAGSLAYLFVPEAQIGRVKRGAQVRLVLRRAEAQALDGVVTGIDSTSSPALPQAMLASLHGGPIAARARPDGELVANEALYRVTVRIDAPAPRLAPVAARIEGERASILWEWARRAAALLVRESGF